MNALIIDADPDCRSRLKEFLAVRGYHPFSATHLEDGLSLAEKLAPGIVIIDESYFGENFTDTIAALCNGSCAARVILTGSRYQVDRAVRAMKSGAEYYFQKPLDFEQVALIFDRFEERKAANGSRGRVKQVEGLLVGNSPQMIGVRRLVSLLAANSTTPVLILGESGAGKQMVTRAIHELSELQGPLVEINCASLSENFLESELFGHERGAFTDAKTLKPGLFEIAASGTIFFDEISEMPLNLQARLLKVLDTNRFRRVGGVAEISTNARFVAATNRDISALVRKGLFREDLYYRISVLPITVPPLRERNDDVIMLAEYFTRVLAKDMGKGAVCISPEAVRLVRSYPWPGNVRELRNVIERALIICEGEDITPAHLPSEMKRSNPVHSGMNGDAFLSLREMERRHISAVLDSVSGNRSKAAAILGISRSTLLAKLRDIC